MIIKNLSHKRFFPQKMLKYVANEDKSPDQEPIYWNIAMPTITEAESAFKEQDNLLRKRKNGNRMLHEILSFSPEDSKHLTDSKLRLLCLEYLKIRASRNVAFAQIHKDTGHPHIHILISPNEYGSSKVTTFNRKQYFQIRHDMERFQKQRFPELEHSIVFLNDKKKERVKSDKSMSDKEYQAQKRTGTKNIKEELKTELAVIFENAQSKEEFFSTILSSSYDLEIYTYRGKNRGILHNEKKYTFRTLGFSNDRLDTLENREMNEINRRLKALGIIQRQKSKDRDLDLER